MNAWMCERCGTATRDGNVDDPPDGWMRTVVPVMGSGRNVTGTESPLLCDACADSLYEWRHA